MNVVKFKKVKENAIIPAYAHDGDAGFDFCCLDEFWIEPNSTLLVKTGLIAEIPVDTEIQVRPRSGMCLKSQVTVLNSPGTIDSNYRGEIGIILHSVNDKPVFFEAHSRIAQGVLCPVLKAQLIEAEVDLETNRGTGGFGSTGIKN